ncbi:3-dehydroquinate synthase [Phormidesmis sp. 146-12]
MNLSLTNPPQSLDATLQPLQQSVTVQFNYAVHFTSGLFRLQNPLFADVLQSEKLDHPAATIVIVDSGLLPSHPYLLEQIVAYTDRYQNQVSLKANPLVVVGGEASKNDPALVKQIQQLISEVGLCRHSYVVAIGGGAVLDLVGYAAATAHRGVRLVRVPTTVLAQDDSGVGVKNSVNAFGKKNFLGTFTPPYAVINDSDFLLALSQRDWISGIVEAVKVALIRDVQFFRFIESNARALVNRDLSVMQQVIYRSCQHHLQHIGGYGDPFEMGSSRPLDFGHWAAHRLEYLTHYRLRHGEAVAIGIALDSTYAYFAGLLPATDWTRILNTLLSLGFDLSVPELGAFSNEPEHPQSVFRGLTEFREHLGGELTLMLLTSLGSGIEVHQVEVSVYQQAIAYLTALSEKQVSQ